jgi:hypothetical protein
MELTASISLMTSTFSMITPLPPTFMRLIELGRAVDGNAEGTEELLRGLAYDEWINWSMPAPSFDQAMRLPTDELEMLIRGLVTAETRLHWAGGSVASGIRLFGILEGRDAMRADELGDWILQHTDNPYLPCGWRSEGQRTMADYRRVSLQRRSTTSKWGER